MAGPLNLEFIRSTTRSKAGKKAISYRVALVKKGFEIHANSMTSLG